MTGKKILFTSHTANFSKFNRPFMKWLRENGNEVHYASAGEEEVFDCDKHFTIPFTRSPFKASNIHAYKQLKQIIDAENYDLIHTHTPMGSVVTRLAARDARKKGTRIIYTAHGFHFFKGAPLLNWITYYPIEKFMARHTDTLITINNEDYERARSRFNTEVRYVSGVGIDEAKFNQTITHEERQKLRSSLGLKRGDFAIIYLAELSKRKNQLWLIEAMAPLMLMNPELHLILAGSDSLNGKCQQLAKELCLENNIHFLGYRKDVVELLQSSDLAVSSSLQEGLPVNVMEAMHVGLPVVAIDCRGNRDLIRDGANGFLVHKGDARDLRDRISLLHVDAKLRTLFSQNSRQIIKNYLLDDVMNEMGKIYSRKKIIVHLLNSNKFSGAENVACELIKQGANKYDSYYCSPEGDINAALRARNVRHIGINALSYFEVSRIVRKYRPDIIHAHDFRASILASFFGRKASIISHIHQNPKWLNGRNVYTMLYRWRIKKFKKIFVVTDVIKKNRVFNNLPEGTVATHHNKIDKEAII